MQTSWLSKQNRPACIFFLAGWGMDPEPFRSIPSNGYDVLIGYDYRQIEPATLIDEILSYSSRHLIAWSMGVWIAGHYYGRFRDLFTSATAINGTLRPVDDKFGIPCLPFDDMIRDLSPQTLEKFYKDMFDTPVLAEHFLYTRPERSLESITEELQTLRQSYQEQGPGVDIFTNRIVSTRDRIFPARSQLRSWGKKNCTRIQSAHFPFYDWSSWDMVIHGGVNEICD